jgi:hypothetical protein
VGWGIVGDAADLVHREDRNRNGKTRKTMSRIGFRALKWLFTSKQVDNIVSTLDKYEQSFNLALQVDQTQVSSLSLSCTDAAYN